MMAKVTDKAKEQTPEEVVIEELKTLSNVLSSDLHRAYGLLREVLVQLYKDKDEYHAELHAKITAELGTP
jgi:hypothetical protein